MMWEAQKAVQGGLPSRQNEGKLRHDDLNGQLAVYEQAVDLQLH